MTHIHKPYKIKNKRKERNERRGRRRGRGEGRRERDYAQVRIIPSFALWTIYIIKSIRY
jgi:hypothetical protein